MVRRFICKWKFACFIFIVILSPLLLILVEVIRSSKNDLRSLGLAIISNNEIRDKRLTDDKHKKYSKLKKIIVWNDYFGSKETFGSGQTPFLTRKCPVNTCYLTSDRQLFAAEELDALLWHGRSFDRTFPSVRYPHTRYVFLLLESPINSLLSTANLDGIFNYTMTYRLDSDVPMKYGASFVQKLPPTNTSIGVNYAAGKTKMAAWFVSRCISHSRREKIVDSLQQYIGVDVYGVCGPLDCSPSQSKDCYKMLERDYKFYLAFENSLCQDYVTEKFYSLVKYNVIPVVYGLANYKEIAPPKSFINVMDFGSVKELAEYLLYLNKNDTAYNEYFAWKDLYFSRDHAMGSDAFCILCEKLHSDHETKVYKSLYDWFEKDSCISGDSVNVTNLTSAGSNFAKRILDISYYQLHKLIF